MADSLSVREFKDMLNQSATWKQATGRDVYNALTYAADQTILVRKEGKRRLVTNTQGQNVVSSTTVFASDAIGIEDQIDGRNVLDVMDMVDEDGTIIGYEVLLA